MKDQSLFFDYDNEDSPPAYYEKPHSFEKKVQNWLFSLSQEQAQMLFEALKNSYHWHKLAKENT